MTRKADHNCRNDAKTRSDIEQYGLSVICIEKTDYLPGFAYSIGLWQKYRHPEIISFALTVKTRALHKLFVNINISILAIILTSGSFISPSYFG